MNPLIAVTADDDPSLPASRARRPASRESDALVAHGMHARPPGRPRPVTWRSAVARWALLVTLASALGCETPVDLASKTSCGSFWSTPPEGQPTVLPPFVTVNAGIGSDELFACFYGDEARHEERAAIRWSVDDPSIASLSPVVGPRTEVTGLRFGRTTARALITGVSVPASIYVCELERGCPTAAATVVPSPP